MADHDHGPVLRLDEPFRRSDVVIERRERILNSDDRIVLLLKQRYELLSSRGIRKATVHENDRRSCGARRDVHCKCIPSAGNPER